MLGGINNGLFLISFSGFLVVGVMAVILKWAFSGNKSVIERISGLAMKMSTDYLESLTHRKITLKVKCLGRS